MKALLKFFFVMFCLTTIVSYASNNIQRNDLTTFQKKLIQQMQQQIPFFLEKYQTPGAAIALVDEHGVIWAQGFGITDKKTSIPITPETLFSIQSQSKLFTALGVLRATQSGLVSLDKPISFYLPNLKVYSVFEDHPVDKITLKHLLSHTAGFAHEAPVGNNNDGHPDYITHMKSILAGTWLQFPVGQGYQYSNVGIDLAGYILQKNSRQLFQDFMQQQVLSPLKMNSSTFDIQAFLNTPDRAMGHIEGITPTPYNYSTVPSGGMYSNVLDMAHYIEFQLNHGIYQHHSLLRMDLLQTMLNIPFPLPGQTEGSALGVWKGKRLNTFYYSHLGRGFGFSNDLEWYPQYRIGIIVLTNKYDVNNVDIKIAHAIIDPLIQHQKEVQRINLEKKIIGEYISDIGTIHIAKGNVPHQFILQGQLGEGPGGNNIENVDYLLTNVENSIFYLKNADQYYRYLPKGETGVATIERINDGLRWYFNEAKDMPEGPNKLAWRQYIGTYELPGYASPALMMVTIKHGYLYFNNFRMREMQPNIFTAANGQMLIFHDDRHASWSNLLISKSNTLWKKNFNSSR